MTPAPLLAIPPFPGARAPRFATAGGAGGGDGAALLAGLAQHRVGGCYWGPAPILPDGPVLLDGTAAPLPDAAVWDRTCDPWPALDVAARVRLQEGDPRGLLALAAGTPLTLVTEGGVEREAGEADCERLLVAGLTGWHWHDPFTGRTIDPAEVIALCGLWRRLIDANRRIHSVLGIAYWKKPTVTPLLWAGAKVPYGRTLDDLPEGGAVAIWRARLTAAQERALEQRDPPVIEIEDGFIRSAGLGADCVPPLSIIADASGPHFAPGAPSELETLLQEGTFPPELLARARALREAIIAGGLSKYETGGTEALPRFGGARRHVLVPGQVEDDRAVTSGGALASNLELLRRARAEAGSEAYVIYKPHPDVLAGHRRGMIPERDVATLADRVETGSPMAALIAMVDELHVNSSLAGFEALMRGKQVTVHGVPFYAGWGLTTDRGPVPPRRTARRTLDELVAAALLVYPRYLDPETGLPCPAEVLVERLSQGAPALDTVASTVVAVRRIAGRTNRLLRQYK
jgi:capsular polysaccharide export protein